MMKIGTFFVCGDKETMPKKSSPKSSPKPKSVKRRVVKKKSRKSKKTEEEKQIELEQGMDAYGEDRQDLLDGAKVCLRAVNGRGVTDGEGNRVIVDVAPSLLSNRVAAKNYGVEKEAQKLRQLLTELERYADALGIVCTQ